MIPKDCKRLAEVDFPIAEVSRHAAKGEVHQARTTRRPSTLWWARRPLASSRAVLMALLMPDPCDPHCPDEFKDKARELLLAMRGRPSGWDTTIMTDEGLRQVLLRFIADFANWDNAAKTEYLETGTWTGSSCPSRANSPCRGPLRGRRFHPPGGPPVGLRNLCQRPQPRRLPDPQGDVGGYPTARAGTWPTSSGRLEQKSRPMPKRSWQTYIPTTSDGATPIAYLWARTSPL